MAKVTDKAQGEGEQQTKLTPKQEAFARAYVETGNASEAYRRAYNCKPDSKPEGIWVRGCTLLAHSKVKVRVEQLQADLAAKHDVTLDYLTEEYKETLLMAKQAGQFAPAVSAITALGKLHGLITDKVDHNHKLSLDEQFEDFIRSIQRGAQRDEKVIEHDAG